MNEVIYPNYRYCLLLLDVAMKEHRRLIVARVYFQLRLSVPDYRGIPVTAVFFKINTVDKVLSIAHPWSLPPQAALLRPPAHQPPYASR